MSKIDFRKHFWKTENLHFYILTIFILKESTFQKGGAKALAACADHCNK